MMLSRKYKSEKNSKSFLRLFFEKSLQCNKFTKLTNSQKNINNLVSHHLHFLPFFPFAEGLHGAFFRLLS